MWARQGRTEDTLASSSVAVGRLVLPRLVARCHAILHRFTKDSLQAGSAAMPAVRLAEMLLLLQELVRLVLHPLVAAALDVPIAPKASAEAHVTAQAAAAGDTLTRGELERPWERDSAARRFVDSEGRQLGWQRAHLLLLYSPLCDLVFLRYTFHTSPVPRPPPPPLKHENLTEPSTGNPTPLVPCALATGIIRCDGTRRNASSGSLGMSKQDVR
ncbi:unnamed protein product [Closterium sp. Naga37s-1]|nr:unnamed protein product [Closterium sp. Naga37s-1]